MLNLRVEVMNSGRAILQYADMSTQTFDNEKLAREKLASIVDKHIENAIATANYLVKLKKQNAKILTNIKYGENL